MGGIAHDCPVPMKIAATAGRHRFALLIITAAQLRPSLYSRQQQQKTVKKQDGPRLPTACDSKSSTALSFPLPVAGVVKKDENSWGYSLRFPLPKVTSTSKTAAAAAGAAQPKVPRPSLRWRHLEHLQVPEGPDPGSLTNFTLTFPSYENNALNNVSFWIFIS